jgi:RHS repeat-associated protein
VYDDQGRRIQKTSGATTTSYLYDGDDIHAEWNGAMSGMPSAVYAQGPGIDNPLLRLTGATNSPGATEAAYLQDGLGSVVGTTNTTGTLTANQRFDAWGVRTASTGATPTYGYTGREPDATGLEFYRNRYYHPGLGRFASRDPMEMADSVSPYAYVANNPTNLIDPMGLLAQLAGTTKNPAYWGMTATAGAALSAGTAVFPSSGTLSGASGLDLLGALRGGVFSLPLALTGDSQNSQSYKYITYTRENPSTGQVYSGRSGGYGEPQQIASQRAAGQPLLNAEGFTPPVVDAVSTNLSAIRGREQQLIDYFGGAQSVGGSTRNKINGVADFNPFRGFYIERSIQEFGPLPDNSPDRPRL